MPTVSGGVGRGVGPSCVLALSAGIDVHAVGVHALKWDQLLNDIYDFAPLAAIPAGLGLSFPFDGSSEFITTTVAGTWAYTLSIQPPAADATVRGYVIEDAVGLNLLQFGPVIASAAGAPGVDTIVWSLPSGVDTGFRVNTITGAAANPFTVTAQLILTRLA